MYTPVPASSVLNEEVLCVPLQAKQVFIKKTLKWKPESIHRQLEVRNRNLRSKAAVVKVFCHKRIVTNSKVPGEKWSR